MSAIHTPQPPPDSTRGRTIAFLSRLSINLHGAAELPLGVVYLNPDLEANAVALEANPCSGTPITVLGTDLLDEPAPALYATLAHEIAHHALKHPNRPVTLLEHLVAVTLAAGIFAIVVDAWQIVALLALTATMLHLTQKHYERRQELAADAHAVTLLSADGHPGRAWMAVMLDGIAATETRWERTLGWVLGSHPPAWIRHQHLFIPPTTAPVTAPYEVGTQGECRTCATGGSSC